MSRVRTPSPASQSPQERSLPRGELLRGCVSLLRSRSTHAFAMQGGRVSRFCKAKTPRRRTLQIHSQSPQERSLPRGELLRGCVSLLRSRSTHAFAMQGGRVSRFCKAKTPRRRTLQIHSQSPQERSLPRGELKITYDIILELCVCSVTIKVEIKIT